MDYLVYKYISQDCSHPWTEWAPQCGPGVFQRERAKPCTLSSPDCGPAVAEHEVKACPSPTVLVAPQLPSGWTKGTFNAKYDSVF